MNFSKEIKIGNYTINEKSPTFIIAEAGVNHGGDIEIAKQLIDVAVAAGVNAVKFQYFKTKNLILSNVSKAIYQQKTTGKQETQFEMLQKLEITQKQNIILADYCKANNIMFLTTPFDEESLEELDFFDLPAYKVASTDTSNLLFLRKIAAKNKPVLLSTGMTYFSEIERALEEILPINQEVILFQCTSNYPVKNTEVNLRVLNTFAKRFNIITAFSDHTEGIGASPYAVAAGAKIVEKHFTLDKLAKGPDHKTSLNPEELIEFVKEIRKVDDFMGNSSKIPTLSEIGTRNSLQKCLVAVKAIKKGGEFTEQNIIAKRTGGHGIPAIYSLDVLGEVATKNFEKDEIIKLN